jgi:hypothetical protein
VVTERSDCNGFQLAGIAARLIDMNFTEFNMKSFPALAPR